jgi:hypothetical protein
MKKLKRVNSSFNRSHTWLHIFEIMILYNR